jgi:SAM-dependent methyltransferase
MDDTEYAINVFNSHAQRAGLLHKLRGKDMLELGPGDSIASAIIAASYGARTILVDSGNFVRTDIECYRNLTSELTKRGLSPPDLSNCQSIDTVLEKCGARYMTGGLKSLEQIESTSIDRIFSQAVLEHIRKDDFRQTMQECYRVLKPEGISSHQVDLKDHLGGALNNLRFSDQVWESPFFVKSGFYTNRIRYNQMLKIFGDVGFSAEVTEKTQWNVLPISREKLAIEYRNIPDDDLSVSGFHVLLKKL